jgi:hypothetical protein
MLVGKAGDQENPKPWLNNTSNSEESRNEKVKYWLNIVIVGELIVKIKRQARIAISIRFCSSPW